MSTIIDELVTDRAKGATYDYADLNRVGKALNYVRDELNGAGANLTFIASTSWAVSSEQNRTQMTAYLEYLSECRSALTALSTTPAVPDSMRYLTYSAANAIEKILADCDDALTRLQLSLWGSGEIYCGEA